MGQSLRGFANYYALADDVKRKLNKAGYMALFSCVKTIAAKHKTSKRVIFGRLKQGYDYFVRFKVGEEDRAIKLWQMKDLRQTMRTWGKIDHLPFPQFVYGRTELVERLNARECERCGATGVPCEIHHVRKVGEMQYADLPTYMRSARLSKRAVLCQTCHHDVHARQKRQQKEARSCREPDALKGARPVRRGPRDVLNETPPAYPTRAD